MNEDELYVHLFKDRDQEFRCKAYLLDRIMHLLCLVILMQFHIIILLYASEWMSRFRRLPMLYDSRILSIF